MIRNKSVYFLLIILIFWNSKPVSSATFENVLIILRLMNRTQPEKTVIISSDNRLDKYMNDEDFDEVKIERQNIPVLSKNSVINLYKVKLLSISNCGLEEIRPGAFKNLPKLEVLDLSDNLLTEVKNGVFTNLNFNTLYLEDNQIAKIEDKAFNNLLMTYLFIDNNRLPAWKSGWFDGTPLSAISMGNNLIESLPRRSFDFLRQFRSRGYPLSLNYVILSNNRIKSIDPYAFEGLKELSNLNLQNNLLEYLEPGLFDSVGEIYTLQLSNNKIKNIYYENFRNTKLTDFEVKNNLLNCISTDIFDVTNLAKLYVDGNPITCHCLKTWEQWRQNNKTLIIDNLAGLKQNCIGKSSGNKSGKTLFLFLNLLILRFVIK